MLEAIIFDMDGVIIDTEPFFLRSENLLLKQYGVEVDLSYHFQFQGTTHHFMWSKMKEAFHLPVPVEQLVQEANQLRAKLMEEEGVQLLPGIEAFIREAAKSRLPLSIASSSPLTDIEKTIRTFRFQDCFSYLVSGESVTHSKPAPDVFLKAAQALQADPVNCLVIEDSKNGVLAGRRANMKVIGYYNLNFPPQDLSPADKIITDFSSLTMADCYELFD